MINDIEEIRKVRAQVASCILEHKVKGKGSVVLDALEYYYASLGRRITALSLMRINKSGQLH